MQTIKGHNCGRPAARFDPFLSVTSSGALQQTGCLSGSATFTVSRSPDEVSAA